MRSSMKLLCLGRGPRNQNKSTSARPSLVCIMIILLCVTDMCTVQYWHSSWANRQKSSAPLHYPKKPGQTIPGLIEAETRSCSRLGGSLLETVKNVTSCRTQPTMSPTREAFIKQWDLAVDYRKKKILQQWLKHKNANGILGSEVLPWARLKTSWSHSEIQRPL